MRTRPKVKGEVYGNGSETGLDDGVTKVAKISAKVSIQTPEQIQLEFEVAGLAARILAYLIDLLIRVVGVVVLGILVSLIFGWAAPGFGSGLFLVIVFSVEWGYNTIIEWLWSGVTPGKKALGLRVVRSDGVAIDFARSAMRNLMRAADAFPLFYATGLLVMFFTGTQRRLGDLAADTMVVREKRARLRELPPLPQNAIELPQGALARLDLRDRDLAMIDEFFRRRRLFSEDRANELASVLAKPLAEKLKLPGVNPERLLAGVLLTGHEVRSSWYGRGSTAPGGGTRMGVGA